jgi:hypothetical protein
MGGPIRTAWQSGVGWLRRVIGAGRESKVGPFIYARGPEAPAPVVSVSVVDGVPAKSTRTHLQNVGSSLRPDVAI